MIAQYLCNSSCASLLHCGAACCRYAVDIVPAQHRGLGISLYRTMGDLGFVVMPIFCGALADVYSVETAFQSLGVMVVSSGVFFALVATPVRP